MADEVKRGRGRPRKDPNDPKWAAIDAAKGTKKAAKKEKKADETTEAEPQGVPNEVPGTPAGSVAVDDGFVTGGVIETGPEEIEETIGNSEQEDKLIPLAVEDEDEEVASAGPLSAKEVEQLISNTAGYRVHLIKFEGKWYSNKDKEKGVEGKGYESPTRLLGDFFKEVGMLRNEGGDIIAAMV